MILKLRGTRGEKVWRPLGRCFFACIHAEGDSDDRELWKLMFIGEADRIEIPNDFFQDLLSNSSLGIIYHFVTDLVG